RRYLPMALHLSSPAFKDGEPIPVVYTCDREDGSPPLEWAGAPGGPKALEVICDDPDAPAGTWVHWVIYDLPAATTSLSQGVHPRETVEHGARQGKNDFRKIGYGGPCPPAGQPHRYFCKWYALDAGLDLEPGATKAQLEKAMRGHILEEAQLIGMYHR